VPTGQIAVSVSAKVSVYAGEKNTVAVRVVRHGFDGSVAVKFSAPAGLTAAELLVPAGGSDNSVELTVVELTADVSTKPGPYKVLATATATVGGHSLSASATTEVTVVPVSRLAISVSPRLQAHPRGKNTFAVRIARSEFDDAVTVSFGNLPDGVKVAPVTIPAGATEGKVELIVEGGTAAAVQQVTVTARANPRGVPVSADAGAVVEVFALPKVPVDVVFVLDCTGSMKKTVAGVSDAAQTFADELKKAHYDVRFGLVGFQDTTLGQPLKIPRIGAERMSPSGVALRDTMRSLRLGGGGGEGESSLDGIAEAADCPFRDGAVRVLLLITDGGPKRSDGRMKSAEDTIKYMKAKKIDQLQVVALPEHRKPFEPLWDGAKGKYFDLKAVSEADAFDKLMTDVAKAISESIPEPVAEKVEPAGAAPDPVLPQSGSVKPPALPPGAQPEEPKLDPATDRPAWHPIEKPGKLVENQTVKPAEAPSAPQPVAAPEDVKQGRTRAFVVWGLVTVLFVCGALLVGQLTFLPGEVPSPGVSAVSYGGGVAVGLIAGAAGYGVFELIGVPLLGRLVGASAFGLCTGAIAPLVQGLFGGQPEPLPLPPEEPDEVPVSKEPVQAPSKPAPSPKPAEQPLELDDEPAPVAPVVPPHKPNIVATKPRDGCPGCGRTIPGPVGERYCMLCDQTF
jgi:hypothetical protein